VFGGFLLKLILFDFHLALFARFGNSATSALFACFKLIHIITPMATEVLPGKRAPHAARTFTLFTLNTLASHDISFRAAERTGVSGLRVVPRVPILRTSPANPLHAVLDRLFIFITTKPAAFIRGLVIFENLINASHDN
jgi:hypothetical protein